MKRLSPEAYIEGILSGDRMVFSRALTLVESSLISDQKLAAQVLEAIMPHTGNSIRVGITGVPGVGKSTFIDAFGTYLTESGKKLAVLAIDPSSEKTKGSILGDKTRMDRLSRDENAFIRPSPTGGSLGGVTRKTREMVLLCEAFGFDVIIIETVGVGQSETAVHSMVDFFLLLMLSGAGDELQGIKKGIMEMANGLVINKADGDNLQRAILARAEYAGALKLFPASESGWQPQVGICSALHGTGIAEVWEMISNYLDLTKGNGWFDRKRSGQNLRWFHETIRHLLEQQFFSNPEVKQRLTEFEINVKTGKIAPTVAAQKILEGIL